MRRAALYARVSTRRQEQEATIESQLDQLLAHVKQMEDEISPEHQFIDQAVSGKYLARPGLDQLRDAAAIGDFQVLYCLSPDRLARNLGAQQVVLDELRRVGVEVVFREPVVSENRPAGIVRNIRETHIAGYSIVVVQSCQSTGDTGEVAVGQVTPSAAVSTQRVAASVNSTFGRSGNLRSDWTPLGWIIPWVFG